MPSKYQEKIGNPSLFNPIRKYRGIFFLILAFYFLFVNGIRQMRKLIKQIKAIFNDDEGFMHIVENIEVVVSKILSILMIVVIFAAIADLAVFLLKELFDTPYGKFNTTLFKIFGLFLNILIALEILENITAYLRKHVFQVELVIVTSLIAVARKIIILDLEKVTGIDIIGLGIAILALSISYWIIRSTNKQRL